MISIGKSRGKLIFLVAAFLLLGSGAAMAGLKYTEQPGFCSTCHVMEPMEETWKHSAHFRTASCNDCHAPYPEAERILFKATSGMGHLYYTVTGQIPENFRAVEKSKKIIQTNCLRCHGEIVGDTKMGGGKYCFECHRSTPHGN